MQKRQVNIGDLNKDLAIIQNDKNLKIYANFTLTTTGFGCFTPPAESQAITTLKKRTAIAQHYKKNQKYVTVRNSLNNTTSNNGTESFASTSPERFLQISPKRTNLVFSGVTTA